MLLHRDTLCQDFLSENLAIWEMERNKVDRAFNLALVHDKIFHIKKRNLIVQPNQFCL